jgi:hypothetical protein
MRRNVAGISKRSNRRWTPIEHQTNGQATLSYYYSDPHSRVPIRDVTSKKDPKKDPNLETLTYGLFSHCNKQERRSIVEKGIRYQFFCTARRDGIRVLTGYYQTGWYYKANRGDYIIRAKRRRFVSPGFPLHALCEEYLNPFCIDGFFRSWRYIPEKVAALLLSLIDETDDKSTLYLSELRRIERWSRDKYGHVYINRLRGCSRKDIPRELRLRSRPLRRNKVTSSRARLYAR